MRGKLSNLLSSESIEPSSIRVELYGQLNSRPIACELKRFCMFGPIIQKQYFNLHVAFCLN